MAQQTAVEYLAERYNYITWMRNRDEISAGTADEWREKFLQEAKAMEKHQIMSAYDLGNQNQYNKICISNYVNIDEEQYYNETYNK